MWLLISAAGVNYDEVLRAIKMEKFKDFENCLQDRCAKKADAKYIITWNTEDFSESEVPAISPENFLNVISN